MSTPETLLLLRLIGGTLLLAILVVLFIAFWQDYRSIGIDTERTRRVYGRLVLRHVQGDVVVETGSSYPLLPLTSIGRSGANTVTINDPFASSEHALIALRNGQWWLEDRQSRNGTLLNSIPVTQPTIITDGDVVAVGSAHLYLELDEEKFS